MKARVIKPRCDCCNSEKHCIYEAIFGSNKIKEYQDAIIGTQLEGEIKCRFHNIPFEKWTYEDGRPIPQSEINRMRNQAKRKGM
jgi:hypothetical protein